MKEAEITVPEHGLGKLKERGKGAGGRAALNARLREELEGLSLRPGAPAMTKLTEELERISFESDVCTALPAEAIDLEPVRWPLNARPLPADRAFELHAQKASRDHRVHSGSARIRSRAAHIHFCPARISAWLAVG